MTAVRMPTDLGVRALAVLLGAGTALDYSYFFSYGRAWRGPRERARSVRVSLSFF